MANGQYYGTIPQITQAYQNDPRTKLAAQALMTGTSTAPVAGGGWAWADGLSRIGNALVGSYLNKQQDKKYAAREAEYMKAMQQAAAMAGGQPQNTNPAQSNPAAANPSGLDGAAAALAGRVDVPQPNAIQPVQLPPSIPAGGSQGGMALTRQGPVIGPMGDGSIPSQRPPMATPFPMVEGGSAPMPIPDPTRGGTGPNRGAVPSARELYFKGIVPIEGGTDRNGKFRTSPKGAIGPGQVMPGTAPEAARLAGLEFNDHLYRTDANYNNALGQAYYAKQLQDFGDPIVAAAAYNAGPGGARRALRQARNKGGDWRQYLPAETRKYVVNFENAVGGAGAGASGEANPATGVTPLQPEQVPDAPVAAQRPNAPALPEQVQTQRIAMAQAMLASNNPDLVSIAQTYLDKGLDEQQQNRTLANQQKFAQSQTGYQADLGNWAGSQADERGFKYGNIRDANQRNFSREMQNNQNEFNIANREDQQAYGTSEREASQGFQAGEANKQRTWQSGEADKDRTFTGQQNDLNRGTKLEIAQQKRANYWSSKEGTAASDELQKARDLIDQYESFMANNRTTATGGPGVEYLPNFMRGDALNAMDAQAKQLALQATSQLKGSISDKDIAFIQNSNVGVNKRGSANAKIARAHIAALQRRSEYLYNRGNAIAEGRAAEFEREWHTFANAARIFTDKGEPVQNPMTFEQWQSRKRYDAQGREIK